MLVFATKKTNPSRIELNPSYHCTHPNLSVYWAELNIHPNKIQLHGWQFPNQLLPTRCSGISLGTAGSSGIIHTRNPAVPVPRNRDQ